MIRYVATVALGLLVLGCEEAAGDQRVVQEHPEIAR